MKPSQEIFLEKITHEELENHVRRATRGPRGWGAPPLPRARPLPHGAPVTPSVSSFLLYIPMYPENIEATQKTLIPPPQPSVPVRSHLGACSGTPPEEGSTMECFYIIIITSPCVLSSLPQIFGSIVSTYMYSSLSFDLNTKFSSVFEEIYSM